MSLCVAVSVCLCVCALAVEPASFVKATTFMKNALSDLQFNACVSDTTIVSVCVNAGRICQWISLCLSEHQPVYLPVCQYNCT